MKKKPSWWQDQEACQAKRERKADAAGQFEAVQREAFNRALTLRAARISKKKKVKVPAMHWMFDDAETGTRVLNYWPSSGTYLSPGGLRGQANDPWEALELATRLYLQLPIDPDEKPFP